jgi:hypothetical protein
VFDRPKLDLAGLRFPLGGARKKLNLSVLAATGGGLVYSQHLDGVRAEILSGVKNKPKGTLRVRLGSVFGMRGKEILIHDDWVRLGDRVYQRARDDKPE